MKHSNKHITVFEHQVLKLNQQYGNTVFDEFKLKALQLFYGEKGVPYFKLICNGIKFCEYVGVLHIGNTTIEVLPKADYKGPDEDKIQWNEVLIGMLKAVGIFNIHAPSSSNLRIKSNTILDLYFELFILELEYLIRAGLVKKYRKIESNCNTLKGNIMFSKHINKNLTHKERFYTMHSTFDKRHQLHQILYKTIILIKQINTNEYLNSRIGALLLNFPEQSEIIANEALFEKISFNRKTDGYKKAIEISRLLLLNYHPDVTNGQNHVLALMFDMNKLWEQFVYVSIRKHKGENTTVTAQPYKFFWKPVNDNPSRIKPDIVVNKDKDDCVVLDTKWKNLKGYDPSLDDLRQMYVYHEYYNAKRVALIYPGIEDLPIKGSFLDPNTSKLQDLYPNTSKLQDKECSIFPLSVESNIKFWQESIYNKIEKWINN